MREIARQKSSTRRGTKDQTETNPSSFVPAVLMKIATDLDLVHTPITVRKKKNPFHFIVIKMLMDVLLTHSTEPHRFYNSSKHLQVVTWVRLSRQK